MGDNMALLTSQPVGLSEIRKLRIFKPQGLAAMQLLTE